MELTPLQLADIHKHIQESGLRNHNLSTELLDHVCCQIEAALHSGVSFEQAKINVLSAYNASHLLAIEKQVQQATKKPNAMQKVLLLAALLGSIFLTSYLLYPSITDEEKSDIAIIAEEDSSDVAIEEQATPLAVSFSYPLIPPKASPLPEDYNHVTSSYGQRIHPIFKVRRLHSGTDFKAPLGTPVFAAGDGVVRFARDSSNWGNLIILDHDSIFTSRYAHLHTIDVKEGSFIYAGEQIGTVGSTGKSSGPHLHYEIHENGVAVDPEIYLPKP